MDSGKLALGALFGESACLRIPWGRVYVEPPPGRITSREWRMSTGYPDILPVTWATTRRSSVHLYKGAVLDIDSTVPARFTEVAAGLLDLAAVLEVHPWEKCRYNLH